MKKQYWGYVFFAPALLHILIFRIYPTINTAILSFYDTQQLGMGNFTLSNYQRLLSPRFLQVIWNTFFYVLGGIIIIVPISLIIALLIKNSKFSGLFKTAYFYPYTMIMVAIAIIWGFGFRQDGFVNEFLSFFGIAPKNWLGGAGHLAMPVLIFVTSWKYWGYFVLIYLSGLEAIPEELYEAAKIDGANSLQSFINITLPQLRPIFSFVLVMSSVELLRQFAIPNVLTAGGPYNQTMVLSLDIYRQGFYYFNVNVAAAESVVLISFAIILSFFQYRITSRM
ncbi:MAG: sugar ABC transporter permease [Thermotogota bacterium]|nr:sugar ABC transporter permease [Thermotogota bacterium]